MEIVEERVNDLSNQWTAYFARRSKRRRRRREEEEIVEERMNERSVESIVFLLCHEIKEKEATKRGRGDSGRMNE